MLSRDVLLCKTRASYSAAGPESKSTVIRSLLWYAKLDNLEYNIENERRHRMNHVKHVIPMSDTSVSISPEDIQPRCYLTHLSSLI